MDIFSIIWSVVGGAVAGSGVVAASASLLKDRWIESVRAEYALELESFKNSLTQDQKRIQARIDRSIFVSRAQFDTEFAAMKDMYRYLTATKLSMELMRPMFGLRDIDETDEERLEDLGTKLVNLIPDFNKFSTEMDSLSPFYPAPLYKVFQTCRAVAAKEIEEIQTSSKDRFSPMWFVAGSENMEKMNQSYRYAAVLIRDRLDRLAVIEP